MLKKPTTILLEDNEGISKKAVVLKKLNKTKRH
jgi:hypothetical protein